MAAFNINLDVIKKMPVKRKALILAGIYLVLAAVYYVLFLQESFVKKGELHTKLTELQGQVAEKEILAAQKNKYIRELKERQEMLKEALTKLPNQREIPGLLDSVAQAGKAAGIHFALFEPKPAEKPPPPPDKQAAKPAEKKPADAGAKPVDDKFYEDIPVRVSIYGGFQSTASFFEKVARLPRIVNIEEIAMTGAQDAKGRELRINTMCIIKTYMFLEKKGEKKTDEKK